jgi:hypothetical protein
MATESKDTKTYLGKFSGTLIAALVLVLLVGYLYFFQIKKTDEEEKQKIFPTINERLIDEIDLKYHSYTLVCRKDEEKWFIFEDSKKFKADDKIISTMAENISHIKIEKVASEDAKDLAGFGLDNPEAEVNAKTPEKKYRILIGSESPTGSGTYIRVDNDSRIILVNESSVQGFLRKSANDLRDKQILSLEEDEIKGLKFKSKNFSFEVEKKDGKWSGKDIPEYIEIDQNRVETIVKTFLNLKIDNFEDDEPKSLHVYGLDMPTAEIELLENGKSVRVLFGNKKESGDYYVKLALEESVYSVSKFVFLQIPESVNDIRVRKIVKLDTDKIRELEIKRGDNRIWILKEGNNWKLEGEKDKKVNESKVSELISEIKGLEVEKFVNDNPSDLVSYGLDKPEIQLTISESDKNMVKILFGRKEDKKVYAKLADVNSVFAFSDDILTTIPSSKADLVEK